MLVIRLQRTGRRNLAAYRVVVAEKARAVSKKYIESLGYYLPTQQPKVIEIDTKKVEAWIAKGAQPSATVASLCKQLGAKDMEKYFKPNSKKAKKKKATEEKA